MSRLSIFQTQWIDLVFEDRNQSYGAYQLRQESTETGLKSLAITFLFVISAFLVFAISSFFNPAVTKAVPVVLPTILELVDLALPPKPDQPKEAILPPAERSATEPNQTNLAQPNVVDQTQATAVVPENTNISAVSTHPDVNATSGAGIGTGTTPSTSTNPEPTPIVHGTNIIDSNELDKNPEFPGGIKVFLNYVASNFRPAEELDNTIKVTVSFVVERDGSMTNIQVRNNPGYGMGEEAIRVLKSMKTRWHPGVKDNQKVRAFYNLPITIQL